MYGVMYNAVGTQTQIENYFYLVMTLSVPQHVVSHSQLFLLNKQKCRTDKKYNCGYSEVKL